MTEEHVQASTRRTSERRNARRRVERISRHDERTRWVRNDEVVTHLLWRAFTERDRGASPIVVG